MAADTEAVEPGRWNYFNYFTEVEEHFQRARGTGLFLMSPVDWALVETWKNGGIPLEAVLRGIDLAFEKWRRQPRKGRLINSVAYCAQAVQEEAQAMAGISVAGRARGEVQAPFEAHELREHLAGRVRELSGRAEYAEIAASLEHLAREADVHYQDLEQLEQRLTALEDKMSAIARSAIPEEELFAARRELDSALRPYRGKMTADQLAMLERQFLEKRVLEHGGLPRLSLFYLK